METQKRSTRIWVIVGGILLLCLCLAAIVVGGASIFLYLSPTSSINSTSSPVAPDLNALATAQEMNALSEALGIIEWKLTQEIPGENRVCRAFNGQSWSATPNEGMNCIYNAFPGSTMEDVVTSFFSDGQFFENERPVASSLNIEYDHVVYIGEHPNAHTVIDMLILKDGRVYWASVSVGTPAGETPEAVYQSYNGALEVFLYEVIMINLSRSQ
jgi:hypothetical protein